MSEDNAALLGGKVLALLREQQETLTQLDALADRQRMLVIEDDPQPLLGLLADRQKLVNRLASLNHQMAPYRQRWTEISHGLRPDDRQAAQTIMADVDQMVGKILASDERDCRLLASRKTALTEELNTTRLGQRANQAYCCGQREPCVLDTTDTGA